MYKLCNINIRRSQEIFERLEEYKEKIVKELKPKKIILFGSLARGDFNEGSDVDIIVIADWKQDFLARIKTLLEIDRCGLPIQPLGYTEEEIELMLLGGNRFITEAMASSKVLYDCSERSSSTAHKRFQSPDKGEIK